jgi:hypothetical protein
VERIEGLVTKGRAIEAAIRMRHAFHEGSELTREYQAWEGSLTITPGIAAGVMDDRMKADVARVMATWNRQPAQVH